MPRHHYIPLQKSHDRSQFDCGHEVLDRYIRQQASQDIQKKVAAVFVSTDNDKVIAYYTLSATTLLLHDLPNSVKKKLPKYPALPATLLGRLAVDQSVQGCGVGEHALVDALIRAWKHSKDIASMAVIVDAIDKQAIEFYHRYHFINLPGYPLKLYLPMKEIEQFIR